MRAFYDLRPDAPMDAREIARLSYETEIDRERQAVERHYRRGNESAMHRALARMHAVERRAAR
jgi:hypothetical protein